MALRGTLTHRKTRRLAKLLDIPLPCALGVLEAVWHVTGEQAKDGGIGRMSDQDIADEIFWDGDPAVLVNALLDSGWLEKIEGCRLYVHDWHDHSDDATDNHLARSGTLYANGARPRMKRLSEQERARLCAANGWSAHGEAQKATACHKEPLPEPVPEPVPEPDTPPTPLPGELVCLPGFVETWADWERHRSEKRQRLTPTARSRQLAMLVRQPDPVACLNQSIQNGWTGLFEVKAEPGRADHDPYAGVPRAGAS